MIFPSYKNYTSHINILKKEIKLGNKYATETDCESDQMLDLTVNGDFK